MHTKSFKLEICGRATKGDTRDDHRCTLEERAKVMNLRAPVASETQEQIVPVVELRHIREPQHLQVFFGSLEVLPCKGISHRKMIHFRVLTDDPDHEGVVVIGSIWLFLERPQRWLWAFLLLVYFPTNPVWDSGVPN
jgi:hypothetical protein